VVRNEQIAPVAIGVVGFVVGAIFRRIKERSRLRGVSALRVPVDGALAVMRRRAAALAAGEDGEERRGDDGGATDVGSSPCDGNYELERVHTAGLLRVIIGRNAMLEP
jgi:hypothetical protein